MTTKKIYGHWIKWHGGECPVPPETMVQVKLRSGIVGELRAGDYRWRRGLGDSDIVEYCVVLEQADLEAAEQLLCANGYRRAFCSAIGDGCAAKSAAPYNA